MLWVSYYHSCFVSGGSRFKPLVSVQGEGLCFLGLLRLIIWQKFTDILELLAASIISATHYTHRPDDDGGGSND
jgi:hypothetical protein